MSSHVSDTPRCSHIYGKHSPPLSFPTLTELVGNFHNDDFEDFQWKDHFCSTSEWLSFEAPRETCFLIAHLYLTWSLAAFGHSEQRLIKNLDEISCPWSAWFYVTLLSPGVFIAPFSVCCGYSCSWKSHAIWEMFERSHFPPNHSCEPFQHSVEW